MGADDDPDVAGLFAPIDITEVVQGVLEEASDALGHLEDPVDAELWGSDVIGALSSAGEAEAMAALARTVVPAAEEAATPGALALLRVFAAIGADDLRGAAGEAASRVAQREVADAPWAGQIGSPRVRDCWHYADVGGRQESLTMMFAYGDKQHAVSVLIDHGRGGKIKDAWVAKGSDQLTATLVAAGGDPLVVFELLDVDDARNRLEQALAAGECPEQSDQAEDIAAHRAFLRARLAQLSGESEHSS
ncbi:MAG TPA: hypothetical protein VF070_41565 [Streptosporangiaceae bacterium]